jgi:hypothetical protein
VTADFDGDGAVDLAVLNERDRSVSVLLNNGSAGFHPGATVSDVLAMEAGDADGDGNVDLIVQSAGSIRVRTGRGDGSFGEGYTAMTDARMALLSVGDFNRDGRLDLAGMKADGQLSVLTGELDGALPATSRLGPLGTVNSTTTLHSSANPSVSGQPLILTANVLPVAATGMVTFYDTATLLGTGVLNNGVATLTISTLSSGQHSLLAYYSGDATYADGFSSFLIQKILMGTAVALASSANPSTLGQSVNLTATVSPAAATGSVAFYDGAAFLGVRTVLSGQAVLTTSLLAAGSRSLRARYSGDGTDAPSTSSPLTQTVGAAPTAANGFQIGATYSVPGGPIAVVDFNGDGKADTAVAGTSLNVLLGKGDGTFQSPAPTAVSGSSLAIGDFNGDGKADIAEASSGSVTVLLGTGLGTFQAPATYPTGAGSVSGVIATSDFNGDGVADLIVTDNGFNLVYVLLGNGDGTFQAAVTYPSGLTGSTPGVVVGDFNLDGKADVALCNATGLTVLLGNGDGSLKAPSSIAVGGSLAMGDFNADGKADLAVVTSTGISILIGNGDGTFQNAVNYPSNAGSPTIGDFNGDGKADIAITGPSGVSILLGNGDGTFQAQVVYASGGGSAAVGDFNADGKADLLMNVSGGVGVLTGGLATHLAFSTPPVSVTAGTPMTVVVQVQDAGGNVVANGASVTLTSSPAGINTTVTVVNGVATFSNLSFNTSGTYTLTASSTGFSSLASNPFTISVGAASKLAFTTQPSHADPSVAITPAVVVSVQDQFGNLVSSSSASITVDSTPAGVTATVTAQNGAATFGSLIFNTPGNYVLTATAGGLTSATSNAFAIGAPTAYKVAFTTPPAGAVAGTAMAAVVVQIQDASGSLISSSNASVTMTSTPAGINTTVSAFNGTATFSNLSLNTAGSYTLTASSTGLVSATSPSFTITAAAPAKVAFTTQPVGGQAGAAIPAVVVQVQDSFGNVATGSSAAVTVTSTPAAVSTSVNAMNGIATFSNLVFNTTGSYTLTASSLGLTGATSNSFSINSGGPAKVAFTTQPTNGTAGTAIGTVVVQIQDAGGNLVTASTAAVALASTPPGVTFQGGSNTVNAVNGVATFTGLVFNTSGSYTLTASSNGLTSATSNSFTINPGNASRLVFTTQPVNTVAGATMPAVVAQVQDAGGNLISVSGASVTLTSAPAGINITTVTVNGVATFSSLVLQTAGSYSLTAASNGLTSATSDLFSISAASASKLAFTTQPGNGSMGTPIPPVVVKVQDTFGNVANGSSASITVTSTPAGVSATVTAVNGVATFSNLTFATGGNYTLAATSMGLTGATSNTFTIGGGPAKLAFTVQPANAVAGTTMAPVVVQIQDVNGNLSGSTASVTLTTNRVGFSVTVAAVNGVATFNNLVLNIAGNYAVMATSSGLTSALSDTFTIAPAAAAKVVFTTQPTNGVAGAVIAPVVVKLQDAVGNVATTSTATITVASSPGTVVAGTTTVSGQANFSTLLFNAAGTYTLTATAAGLTSATSSSFNITITLPVSKPGVFRSGVAFLEDSNGNGAYDAGTDRYIPSFTGPGGFLPGDTAVVGDWNGDGHAKVGVYRSSSGQWFLDLNNDGVFNQGDATYGFGGVAGDIPVVGDWNGVQGLTGHKDCIGVFRAGFFWVLDLNCNGTFDGTPTDAAFPFGGVAGDVPVVGNWTGGTTRVGVVRKYAPAGIPQGNPFFWVVDSGNANAGNLPANHQPDLANCFAFGGLTGDVFVTGDWYGTGTATAGVYRVGLWVLDLSKPGAAQANHVPGITLNYGGVPGDVPVAGKW